MPPRRSTLKAFSSDPRGVATSVCFGEPDPPIAAPSSIHSAVSPPVAEPSLPAVGRGPPSSPRGAGGGAARARSLPTVARASPRPSRGRVPPGRARRDTRRRVVVLAVVGKTDAFPPRRSLPCSAGCSRLAPPPRYTPRESRRRLPWGGQNSPVRSRPRVGAAAGGGAAGHRGGPPPTVRLGVRPSEARSHGTAAPACGGGPPGRCVTSSGFREPAGRARQLRACERRMRGCRCPPGPCAEALWACPPVSPSLARGGPGGRVSVVGAVVPGSPVVRGQSVPVPARVCAWRLRGGGAWMGRAVWAGRRPGHGCGTALVSVGGGIPVRGFPGGPVAPRRLFRAPCPPRRVLPASRACARGSSPLAPGAARHLGPSGALPRGGYLCPRACTGRGTAVPRAFPPLCAPSLACRSHSLARCCGASAPTTPSHLASALWSRPTPPGPRLARRVGRGGVVPGAGVGACVCGAHRRRRRQGLSRACGRAAAGERRGWLFSSGVARHRCRRRSVVVVV